MRPCDGSAPDPTDSVHVSLRSGVYADSVKLMQVSKAIGARDGVTAVLVAMATPLNLELAAGMGLSPDAGAAPDQLLIALRAVDETELAAAVTAVEAALTAREERGSADAIPPRTVGFALGEEQETPAGGRSACPAPMRWPRRWTPSPPAAACWSSPTASPSSTRWRSSRPRAPPASW